MRKMPGVSVEDFAEAIKQFKAIVSDEWVFTSDEDLHLYRDAYSPFWDEPGERIASAAVAPKTVEEIQAIVKVANEFKITLYTISTGKNLGYGGSAPAHSGDVVLDLKRMNKILEISEKNAYVLVEPGVSYFDLYNYIQEKGLKLWVDVPDPGWGSVVGNALDRGSGYTLPNIRNHFEAHCGMEVVLANGEVMRTGLGALPNSETWQQHKTGFGPYVNGIFSQSNFGIVTKMGFWLMPEPEAMMRCDVYLPRYDDLAPAVDLLNYLENLHIFNGTPDIGSPLLSTPQIAQWLDYLENGYPVLEEEHQKLIAESEVGYSDALQAYGLKNDLAYWNISFTFYGPDKANMANWEYVQEKYKAIAPDAKFTDGERFKMPLTKEQIPNVNSPEFGIPTLRNFAYGARSKSNPNPSNGHVWFAPIIPRTGADLIKANEVFLKVAKELDVPLFGGFILPTCYWERSFVLILGFPVTHDIETNKKTRAKYEELIKIAADHGWSEYRASTAFQDEIMDTYSFNDHALLKFHETLKDAVDPNGILSPGRYGVLPKHLRKERKGKS